MFEGKEKRRRLLRQRRQRRGSTLFKRTEHLYTSLNRHNAAPAPQPTASAFGAGLPDALLLFRLPRALSDGDARSLWTPEKDTLPFFACIKHYMLKDGQLSRRFKNSFSLSLFSVRT